MKISRNWLEEFLRRPLDAKDVAARLTLLGAPVDAIESTGTALSPFVVGLVRKVEAHPEADKLSVTQVDDGTGTLHTVVCGAPNVVAGARYPFARIGTTMPNGMVIEKRKIRGQRSEGMLCSARELGLGEDHSGILMLETDADPGTPLLQVLDAGDDVFELDVTPNRPDLLCHKGVARELAASYKCSFRMPPIPDEVNLDLPTPTRHGNQATTGGVKVEIQDPGCPRFFGAVIEGVTVGPSPRWLQQRLESIGLRSINNVVDATNYIMLELNQPMHAYDATTLTGNNIVVRASVAGEKLVTLDGVERNLASGTLVIADAGEVIGIAGVMGGLRTEVTDQTTRLFVECASFNPSRIRSARRQVGLSTDASFRFERGVDRWGAVDAFRRCLRLIATVAGGTLADETVDCYPEVSWPPRIFLRIDRVTKVLGVEIRWEDLEKHLVAIGATVVHKPDDARIAVDIPGWRPDLQSEIDLIEEMARLHGYEEIPSELRPFRPGLQEDAPAWHAADRVRRGLSSLGLSEVMTLPMVAAAGESAPVVLNPLSQDHRYLREALLPSLIRLVEANWSTATADIRLFEVGNVFARQLSAGRPEERLQAAFLVTGGRNPTHWTQSGERLLWDRWDARNIFERLVALAHPDAIIEIAGERWEAKDREGALLGWCGQIEADAPAWASALYGGEVEVAAVSAPPQVYQPLPGYPAVQRDLALLLDQGQRIAAVEQLLRQRGRRHGLEAIAVVDEYRGKGLPDGKRSVAIRLTFRAVDRTLKDAEVDEAVRRLLTSLERELDVTLRTT